MKEIKNAMRELGIEKKDMYTVKELNDIMRYTSRTMYEVMKELRSMK